MGLLSIILITQEPDLPGTAVLPRQNSQTVPGTVPGGNVAFSFAPTVQAEAVPGGCLVMPAITFEAFFPEKKLRFRDTFWDHSGIIFGQLSGHFRGTTRSRFIRAASGSLSTHVVGCLVLIVTSVFQLPYPISMRLAGGEGLNQPVCTVVLAAGDGRRATDDGRRTARRKTPATRV